MNFLQRKSKMRKKLRFATLCLIGIFLLVPQAAEAVPIRTLPDLVFVQPLETTGGNTIFNFTPDSAALTTRLGDRLSNTNNDFLSPSFEAYDFYYSDADGNFDIDGSFLTITAVFDNILNVPMASGLNIAGASLQINADFEFASFVSSFVALGSNPLPATVTNALGDTAGTTTFLGDTIGQPDDIRLSLTLGFESTRPPTSVPEPTTVSLFLLGLAGLGFARLRKRGAVKRRRCH